MNAIYQVMKLSRHRRRSDEELLVGAARQSAAFGELYDRYERPVLLYMRRRVTGAELAADLTAEVFATALEAAESYEPRPDVPASAWLFGIARNVLWASYRHARVDASARERLGLPRMEITDDAVERIDRLVDREDGARMLAALERLPREHREAVRARILEDREYPEIASALQCSPAVVRQRVSRGLAALRNEAQNS